MNDYTELEALLEQKPFTYAGGHLRLWARMDGKEGEHEADKFTMFTATMPCEYAEITFEVIL